MKLLSDLPRNARYPVFFQPLWALFSVTVLFYAPLYMKAVGLSDIEIGTINTSTTFFAFFWHFLAGPITNKMGRRKTIAIFDVICWGIAMLVWALARNFWWFLAAGLINSSVKVAAVSWNCLISEDTPANKRARVFSLMYFINSAAGLLIPVAGLFISKYGTEPTMRVLYTLAGITVSGMSVARYHFTTETRAGLEIMKKHGGQSLVQSFKSFITTTLRVYRNRRVILVTLVFVITNFIAGLNFFQVIYFKEQLKYDESVFSLTPAINALLNILLFVFAMPYLRRMSEVKNLIFSLLACAVGALMFLFMPAYNPFILFLTMGILAAGNFIVSTNRDAVFMNSVDDDVKADAFSAVLTITTLSCVPAGYIAGWSYSLNPVYPFIIILCLYAIAAVFAVMLAVDDKCRTAGIKDQLPV